MARELKRLVIADFQRRFADMTSGCVLIDYQGLDSEKTADLRSVLRESGIRMRVVHNRLAKGALAERGDIPAGLGELFRGPTAVLFGEDGALTASKTLANWRKKNNDLAPPRGGLFEGKVLSTADVIELAKIPDRETLRSQIAGLFLSPAQFLAGAASQLVSHFAGCVKAHHESLSGGGDDSTT